MHVAAAHPDRIGALVILDATQAFAAFCRRRRAWLEAHGFMRGRVAAFLNNKYA